MFYSHTLLSSKGPLGAIWIAAFLNRKLRKDLVAETNICKIIDHIMRSRDPIALRVLAHLLLGVVRIYSKKVEYLHNDCYASLTKIKNSIASNTKTIDLSEEAKSAPYDLVTLPETFELDLFNLKDLGHQDTEHPDVHVKPHEQITLQEEWENDVWDQYETFAMDEDSLKGLDANISVTAAEESIASMTKTVDLSEEARSAPHDSVTLPVTFELHLFNLEDLGHQETEYSDANVKPREKITLQEVWENDVRDQYITFSMDEDSHMGLANQTEFASTGIPAEEDVQDTLSGLEASREKVQGVQLPSKEFMNHEISHVVEKSSDSEDDPMEIENHSDCIREQGNHIGHIQLKDRDSVATTPAISPEKLPPEASGEKLQNDQLSVQDFPCHEILYMVEEPSDSVEDALGTGDRGKSLKESGNHVEYIKLQERCPVATTPARTPARTPEKLDLPSLGDSTPEFMVLPTPAKKEQDRGTKKRKDFFDDTIVLSNEVMRKRLKYTKSILRGGKESLRTAIDIWKAHKIFHVLQSFSEPSVPFMSSELKALFQSKTRALETELQEDQPVHETRQGLPEGRQAEHALPEAEQEFPEDCPTYETEQAGQPIHETRQGLPEGREPVCEAEQVLTEAELEFPEDCPTYEAEQVGQPIHETRQGLPESRQPVCEAEQVLPEAKQEFPEDCPTYKTEQVGQPIHETRQGLTEGQPIYEVRQGLSEAEQEFPEDCPTYEAELVGQELSADIIYEAEHELPEDPPTNKAEQVDQELSANKASDFTGQSMDEAGQELPDNQPTYESEHLHRKLSANNASDSMGNRIDEAQDSMETDKDTDHESVFDMLSDHVQSSFPQGLDNWSIRTRAVWQFLQTLLTQKEGILNLTRILEGRTKAGCARFFMEILALKTLGYIDVRQDSPFGEILLFKTPKFKEAEDGNCSSGKDVNL